MENKKDLNIWLLVLSLITIITILLPFAKTLQLPEDLSLWIKIIFFGTIAIFIACLTLIAIISLTCLIKDNYRPIKFIEFLVLLSLLMVFINIITFACSDFKLTPGYAVMALEAFIMGAFSQSGRLFYAFPGFGKDLLSIFRKNDSLSLSEKDSAQVEKEDEEKIEKTGKKEKKQKKNKKEGNVKTETPDEASGESSQKQAEKFVFYDETLENQATPEFTEKISDMFPSDDESNTDNNKKFAKGKKSKNKPQ